MTNVMKVIVEADVKLGDVRAQNFIVIRGTSLVVAVNFADAYYGYRHDKDRRWGVNAVGQAFLDSLRAYKDLVFDWVNKNMPEDVRAYYRLHESNKNIVPVW